MISEELLAILACPVCKGALEQSPDQALYCRSCGLRYPVRDGIPVMLVEAAERVD